MSGSDRAAGEREVSDGSAELSDASPLFTGCQVRSSRTGHLSYGSHYGARYTALAARACWGTWPVTRGWKGVGTRRLGDS